MKVNTLHAQDTHLGFQIAPMIDVVFVIMLFFMVMAGAIKAERVLATTMPGSDPKLAGICADELVVSISEDGYITLNDDEVAEGTDAKLMNFGALMTRIQRDAEARGSKVLVTLHAEENARYQRIVDVLNALGKARITDVVFTFGEEP